MIEDFLKGSAGQRPSAECMNGAGRKLMTEAEALLFLRVSREAILRFRRHELDPIPCMKAGRRYLYDPEEVKKWARRQAKRVYEQLRHI